MINDKKLLSLSHPIIHTQKNLQLQKKKMFQKNIRIINKYSKKHDFLF